MHLFTCINLRLNCFNLLFKKKLVCVSKLNRNFIGQKTFHGVLAKSAAINVTEAPVRVFSHQRDVHKGHWWIAEGGSTVAD